jgi:hypothetical protein
LHNVMNCSVLNICNKVSEDVHLLQLFSEDAHLHLFFFAIFDIIISQCIVSSPAHIFFCLIVPTQTVNNNKGRHLTLGVRVRVSVAELVSLLGY